MLAPVFFIILAIVIAMPAAWMISEFKTNKRWLRCTLGIIAILCCSGVAVLAAQIVRLNYNIWYSNASRKLIDTAIEKLEAGQTTQVLAGLKDIQTQLRPTYEKKGHYDVLVNEAVKKMNNSNPQELKKINK